MMSTFFQKYFVFIGDTMNNPGATPDMGAISEIGYPMIGMMVAGVLATSMVVTVVYSFMIIYSEKGHGDISVDEIWQRVKRDYLMIVISALVIAVLSYIGMIFLILPGIAFSVYACLVLFIQVKERKGFFAALSRSFQLVKSNWWATFGLILVTYFIVSVVSFVFAIPMYSVMMYNMFHDMEAGGMGFATETSASQQLLSIMYNY